jgi:hypothetical protein
MDVIARIIVAVAVAVIQITSAVWDNQKKDK